jgi:hypothetical protein
MSDQPKYQPTAEGLCSPLCPSYGQSDVEDDITGIRYYFNSCSGPTVRSGDDCPNWVDHRDQIIQRLREAIAEIGAAWNANRACPTRANGIRLIDAIEKAKEIQ